MKKALIVLLIPLISLFSVGRIFALSAQDLFSLNNDSVYYDGSQNTNTGATLNGGICITMSCITINNKTDLIASIAAYIKSLNNTSPFNGTAMATAIVDGSIAENINPFLVIAIGWHESQLGTQYPLGSFNAFGRTAGPGQPSVTALANGTGQEVAWYAWPSWLASISDPSTDEENFLKVEYADQGINSISAFVNKYAPSGGGNNPEAYTTMLTTSIESMIQAAGSSITVSSGGVGAALALSCNSSVNYPTVRQRVVAIAEQQLGCWQNGSILPPGGPIYDYSGVDEEWCADFASWVYNQAGYPFTGGNGGWDLPGVSEIYSLGLSGNGFTFHPSGSYVPQPGDLAIHSDSGAYYGYMGHVNIVVAVSASGDVTLIGGDQTNPLTGGWKLDTSIVSEVGPEPSTSDSIIGYVSPK